MRAEIDRASDLYPREKIIMEINTLEDLVELIKKEGDIIIYAFDENEKTLNITIYDFYVE